MKMQTVQNQRGTSQGSHGGNKSFNSSNGSIGFKQPNGQGQENRRPLLQRVFGNTQQSAKTQHPNSGSVGPASRGASGPHSASYMAGSMKQKSGSAAMGISLPAHKSGSAVMHPTKSSHLARIPNASVVSAGPPSHHQGLTHYGNNQTMDSS